jgi:hypothetical protein
MRPTIECLNDIRAHNREHGIHKSKWKAPKLAPSDPDQPVQPISWSYAMTLAVRYHQRRQAEIAEAKHLAALGDFEIPF